ncbi:hypothetical protein B0H16DRAFT_810065 [Mycena metata]|uniref:Uncharacterized protein n=1 Tax=Mycena metata TaxID=1033252 RepID=A0AAD7K8I4_9AGAR|nr:hypothetical protein B0H16DRAFT_810065 [Mycena metata]
MYHPQLNRISSPPPFQFNLTPDPITIPSEYSAYVGFKHRLWVTWHLRRYLGAGWSLGQEKLDLWLWEDEDEQYLEGFALSRSGLTAITARDWASACSAFEVHLSQSTTFVNPLAHLTCQNRLRFIVWLNLTKYGKLSELIGTWGNFLSLPFLVEVCQRCKISRFLENWLETMREVYPLEDLQLIPWECPCECFAELLRSLLLGAQAPRVNLPKTSPIFRALYRLVAPTWPLTLWMAFRASNNIHIPKFLDILQDPVHRDVILNDSDEHDPFLHWETWADYAVEIDLTTWLQIRNTVCKRARCAFHRDVRVAAACLIFSPSPESAFSQLVLEKLGISVYPFDIVTLVVSKHYEPRSNYAQFASKEFWTSQNLENWIETRRLDFCHAVWQTSHLGVLERLSIILNTLQNQAWAPQVRCFISFALRTNSN